MTSGSCPARTQASLNMDASTTSTKLTWVPNPRSWVWIVINDNTWELLDSRCTTSSQAWPKTTFAVYRFRITDIPTGNGVGLTLSSWRSPENVWRRSVTFLPEQYSTHCPRMPELGLQGLCHCIAGWQREGTWRKPGPKPKLENISGYLKALYYCTNSKVWWTDLKSSTALFLARYWDNYCPWHYQDRAGGWFLNPGDRLHGYSF